MSFELAISRLKKKLNNGFIRNLGWMGLGQIIIRIFRLVATIALARFLTKRDYGLAAIILTTYEFIVVFTKFGISGKLIQADEENLESLCNGAYWLNWVMCVGLFVFQCLVAFPVAWFYKEDRLIIPIIGMATIYLILPLGRIQAVLIQRENRLKVTSLSNAIQVSVGNVLTAVFAFFGMGMWAIVLPKIFSTPIGTVMSLAYHPWRLTKGFTTERWGELYKFGISLLGTALLQTLRNNFDYLIVGAFLGVEELGIYFFAFNAGLGISLTIIQSISAALYPHLCALRSDPVKFKQQYFSSLKLIGLIIVPFVILQSVLAPLYVPVVFGQKWVEAIPILIVICISAIPRPFSAAASSLLIASGMPNLALQGDVIFTIIFTIGLFIGVQWQAMGVAIAVLVIHAVYIPCYTIWATRRVFNSHTV